MKDYTSEPKTTPSEYPTSKFTQRPIRRFSRVVESSGPNSSACAYNISQNKDEGTAALSRKSS